MPSSQGGMAGLFNNLVDGLQGVEDRRNMAELAAGRFDAIGGDQAAYWAKSLRANPRAALKSAEQFGGFQTIETNLQGARARAQAMQAATSGDMQRILFEQSPGDAKTAAEIGELQARGSLYGAQADVANRMTEEVWGNGSRSGAGGGFGSRGAELEYKLALASGDSTKIRAARDRLDSMTRTYDEQLNFLRRTDPSKAKAFKESLQSLPDEGIRKLATDRGKFAAGIPTVFDVRAKLDKMTDFEAPGWEFSIAVELNKALQPDSAVLLSEAQVLYDNLTDEMSKVGRMVEGVWEPTGRLDTAGRQRLWNMAVDLTDAGMEEYKKLNQSWEKQNRDTYKFDGAIDTFTRPGSEYLPRINSILSSKRPESRAANALPLKKGMREEDLVKGRDYIVNGKPNKWLGTEFED